MQHVRIREHEMPFFANCFARIPRRVSVVGEDTKGVFEKSIQIVKLSELILREGFRRKQIQPARIGILENGVSAFNVPVEAKYILIGLIIVINTALGQWQRRRRGTLGI